MPHETEELFTSEPMRGLPRTHGRARSLDRERESIVFLGPEENGPLPGSWNTKYEVAGSLKLNANHALTIQSTYSAYYGIHKHSVAGRWQ